jgi:hypothetical protein
VNVGDGLLPITGKANRSVINVNVGWWFVTTDFINRNVMFDEPSANRFDAFVGSTTSGINHDSVVFPQFGNR